MGCFSGPIPGFELLLETVPVCVVSLVLIGAGVASASLCGYLGMLDCARKLGSSEDILVSTVGCGKRRRHYNNLLCIFC